MPRRIPICRGVFFCLRNHFGVLFACSDRFGVLFATVTYRVHKIYSAKWTSVI